MANISRPRRTRRGRRGGSKYYPSNKKVEVQRKLVPTNSQLNKKIVKIQKSNELSFLDQFGNFTVTNDILNPTLLLCNPVSQGDNNKNRDKMRIRLTSLQFRATISLPASNTFVVPPLVRIFVFFDKQANQANPEVYGNDNSAGLFNTQAVTEPIYSFTNINNQMRYKILYDKIHTVNFYSATYGAGGVNASPPNNTYLIRKKIKLNRITQYDDPLSGITTISTNSLWIGMCSNILPSATTNRPIVSIAWRIHWKEY